jgi:hypothetical protein
MSILPPGEQLRRAVEWISEERRAQPARSTLALVEEAAMRFDLGPNQEEWLLRMLIEAKNTPPPPDRD